VHRAKWRGLTGGKWGGGSPATARRGRAEGRHPPATTTSAWRFSEALTSRYSASARGRPSGAGPPRRRRRCSPAARGPRRARQTVAAGPAAVAVLHAVEAGGDVLVPLVPFLAAPRQQRLADDLIAQELLAAVGAEGHEEGVVAEPLDDLVHRLLVRLLRAGK